MKDKDLNYISNIVHIDCSICNYGMKDFLRVFILIKRKNKGIIYGT